MQMTATPLFMSIKCSADKNEHNLVFELLVTFIISIILVIVFDITHYRKLLAVT